MSNIRWARVVLGGLIASFIWAVLYALLLPLVGRDFLNALPGGHGQPPVLPGGHHVPGVSATARAVVMIFPYCVGISTMWLYASIRPRYGAGPRTAAAAGLALWFISSSVDVFWAALGAVPFRALVGPVTINLPTVIIAAIAGAAVYKE